MLRFTGDGLSDIEGSDEGRFLTVSADPPPDICNWLDTSRLMVRGFLSGLIGDSHSGLCDSGLAVVLSPLDMCSVPTQAPI